MIKGVIFDMDGVIIDSEPIHLQLERAYFNDLNIDISDEEHSSYVGRTNKDIWTHIKDKHQLSHSVQALIEAVENRYLDHLVNLKNAQPIEGVKELIIELHDSNKKLALASSSPLRVIKIVLDMFELDKYFNVVVSGEHIENGKPAPDIFLEAAKQLELSPKNCMVIEDSSNGVKAAKRAGMKCVGFKNTQSGNQDLSLADKIIHRFSDIDSIEEMF